MGHTTQEDELLARRGHYEVDGTSVITHIPHYGFQPTEDTVIASWLTYDSQGNEYDMVAYFGISGKTIVVEDAAYIIPPEMRTANKHSFQLTSGAGNLLRK
jgi:hypothetical protein